jgi:hypothetical protein
MQYRFSVLLTATEKSYKISVFAIHVIACLQDGAVNPSTFMQ